MGIYSIKKFGLTSSKGRDRVGVGIRSSYIRVLGIQVDTDGSGELALRPWPGPARRLCQALFSPLHFHAVVRVSGAIITKGSTSFLAESTPPLSARWKLSQESTGASTI